MFIQVVEQKFYAYVTHQGGEGGTQHKREHFSRRKMELRQLQNRSSANDRRGQEKREPCSTLREYIRPSVWQ